MKQSPSDSLTPQSAQPLREATQIALQVPLDEDETKELLLCALYIIKNLEQGSGDNFNDDDNDDDSNNNNNNNFCLNNNNDNNIKIATGRDKRKFLNLREFLKKSGNSGNLLWDVLRTKSSQKQKDFENYEKKIINGLQKKLNEM